jgi:hypothetical protein
MPTVDLTDAEHAALLALIRRTIEEDRFPRAPRLDPLRTSPREAGSSRCGGAQEAADPKSAKTAPQQSTTPKGRPRGS